MLNKVIQLIEWVSNMVAITNQTNHTYVLFKSKTKLHDVGENCPVNTFIVERIWLHIGKEV